MLKIVAQLNGAILSRTFVEETQKYDPACTNSIFREKILSDDFDSGNVDDDFWKQVQSENQVPETCFWIDVNIDGVQLFKNSKLPQVGPEISTIHIV